LIIKKKNLEDLIVIINEFNSSHMNLVSDDRSPADLKENGHIDYLIRSAISLGLTPIRAIQMGSINTTRYFGLKNLGVIAPGFKADFILLDDLDSFNISQVFLEGRRIERVGHNRTITNNVNDMFARIPQFIH
jgi:adenine deaminase